MACPKCGTCFDTGDLNCPVCKANQAITILQEQSTGLHGLVGEQEERLRATNETINAGNKNLSDWIKDLAGSCKERFEEIRKLRKRVKRLEKGKVVSPTNKELRLENGRLCQKANELQEKDTAWIAVYSGQKEIGGRLRVEVDRLNKEIAEAADKALRERGALEEKLAQLAAHHDETLKELNDGMDKNDQFRRDIAALKALYGEGEHA